MKYDAFISYRHLEKDMFVAKGIHKALETARIPGKIRKLSGKKKIQRVFRDQEELPIGSDLGENIEEALRESEYLIVICSPQTKESVWVMKEIDTFIELHGRSNILAVLVEGEPEESFPEQILRDDLGNSVEPLAADVRGLDKKDTARKIKSESLRLAAAIIGCDYDDLRQRHRERKMRRYVGIAAVFAVMGVGFGAYNAYSRAMINENYRQMQINESKVLAGTSADILEEGDRKTAALVAVEALPHEGNDRPYVVDASYALSNALGSYKLGKSVAYKGVYEHKLAVKKFYVNDEGTLMASYDEGQNIYIWDLQNGELSFYDRPEDSISNDESFIEVAADKSHCFFASHDNFYALNPDGTQLYKIPLEDYCYYCGFSNDVSKAAFVDYHKVRVYNTSDGSLIGEYPNPDEEDYFDEFISFSESGDKLAVSHHKSGNVTLIDLKTSEQTIFSGGYDKVTAMNFSVDGGFIIASADFTGDYSEFKTSPMNVRKYDLETGEMLFDKEYEYNGSLSNPWFCKVSSREYTVSDGSYSEIILTACQSLYTLDLKTGELINKYNTPQSDVTGTLLYTSNHNAYVSSYDGMVYFINATSGFVYDGYEFSAGDSVKKLTYGGKSFFTQGSRSPFIKELTWVSDPSGELLTKFDDYGDGAFFASPEGNTYCMVRRNYAEKYNELILYDAKTDERIGSAKLGDGSYQDTFYLDEDTIVVPTDYSEYWYYDVKTDKAEKVSFEEEATAGYYDRTTNGKYVILRHTYDIIVIDTEKRKVVIKAQSGSYENSADYKRIPEDVLITKDGKTFYLVFSSGDVVKADAATGEEQMLLEGCKAYKAKLSPDDSYLLVTCGDATLRILDTNTGEVTDELEFYHSTHALVQMSEDNRLVFLQGADSYFRIYDVTKKEFVFETDGQAGQINKIEEDPENQRLIIYIGSYMFLMDTETYGFTARAELGQLYFGSQGKIISYTFYPEYEIYRFDLKTTEDLMREVKERYGDAALTESQKRKYKIG